MGRKISPAADSREQNPAILPPKGGTTHSQNPAGQSPKNFPTNKIFLPHIPRLGARTASLTPANTTARSSGPTAAPRPTNAAHRGCPFSGARCARCAHHKPPPRHQSAPQCPHPPPAPSRPRRASARWPRLQLPGGQSIPSTPRVTPSPLGCETTPPALTRHR